MTTENKSAPAKKKLKGEKGGECNRTACSNVGVQYYNRSTLKYYCVICANSINFANVAEAKRLYPEDGLLCVRDDTHAPAATTATAATKGFHAHLDECEQCRNHPFNLCAVGATLIQQSAHSSSPHSGHQ